MSIRSKTIFDEFIKNCAISADRMFAKLLVIEWVLAVFFAVWISPKTWVGADSAVHIHLYAAIFGGAVLTIFPLILVKYFSGEVITRHVIAVSQLMYSGLLIHLTGGRIETHFHIFGSIAFLVLYRDSRVLITASLVTVADHFIRGYLWPHSIYGVLSATPWRALEHAGWVVFADTFLILSNISARKGIWRMAVTQRDLENLLRNEEHKVKESETIISRQQQSLMVAAKQSALGEMAGQIAHEINTPLGAIVLTAQGLRKKALTSVADPKDIEKQMDFILQITTRLTRITNSMRKLAGLGGNEPISEVLVKELIEDTLLICDSRFRKNGIAFTLTNQLDDTTRVQCRANEIAQVLVNLINNASDAIKDHNDKWITLDVSTYGDAIRFKISDSGPGISAENLPKLFLPQFSTKTLDSGTGLGLTICKKLIEQHKGRIFLDATQAHTTFVFEIPLDQTEALTQNLEHL